MKKKMYIRRDEEGVSSVIAIILMVAITVVLAAVLYSMVTCSCGPRYVTPTGIWGNETVVSSTEVDVEFGEMNPKVRPTNLELLLIRNNTTEGGYRFSSNWDGVLIHKNGTDIGNLAYEDLEDNLSVDVDDRIRLINLAPNSEYVLRMTWAPSGDDIASITFSTVSE